MLNMGFEDRGQRYSPRLLTVARKTLGNGPEKLQPRRQIPSIPARAQPSVQRAHEVPTFIHLHSIPLSRDFTRRL